MGKNKPKVSAAKDRAAQIQKKKKRLNGIRDDKKDTLKQVSQAQKTKKAEVKVEEDESHKIGAWRSQIANLDHDLILSGLNIRLVNQKYEFSLVKQLLVDIFGKDHMCYDVEQELVLIRSTLPLPAAVQLFNVRVRMFHDKRIYIQTRAQVELSANVLQANHAALEFLKTVPSDTVLPQVSAFLIMNSVNAFQKLVPSFSGHTALSETEVRSNSEKGNITSQKKDSEAVWGDKAMDKARKVAKKAAKKARKKMIRHEREEKKNL